MLVLTNKNTFDPRVSKVGSALLAQQAVHPAPRDLYTLPQGEKKLIRSQQVSTNKALDIAHRRRSIELPDFPAYRSSWASHTSSGGAKTKSWFHGLMTWMIWDTPITQKASVCMCMYIIYYSYNYNVLSVIEI